MPNMNQCNDILDTALMAEACKHLEVPHEGLHAYVRWYAWPITFPDTTGPHGGMGGSTPTTFQCYAFQYKGKAIKTCDGVWKEWNGTLGCHW